MNDHIDWKNIKLTEEEQQIENEGSVANNYISQVWPNFGRIYAAKA
jgi:hypothetical protein